MDPNAERSEAGFAQLLSLHEQETAPTRARLARRTAAEVLFDDYVLEQLRKGKAFRSAIREAGKQFPTEAVKPTDEGLAELERHYQYILNMLEMDERFAEIERLRQAICENEQKMVALTEPATADPHLATPASPVAGP